MSNNILTKFSSTNFLGRSEIKKIINCIPELSCYDDGTWARKPLPPEAFQLLIKITYEGALRIDEGIKIIGGDISYGNRELRLGQTKTGWETCRCAVMEHVPGARKRKIVQTDKNCKKCFGVGKFRIPQFTNLPVWLINEISVYVKKNNIKPDQYLFESPSFPGKHISYGFVQKYLPEITQKCHLQISARYKVRRINQLYSHIFRKSKAKQMLIDGLSLGDVVKKLRHKDAMTTTIYIMSENEDLARKEHETELQSFEDY